MLFRQSEPFVRRQRGFGAQRQAYCQKTQAIHGALPGRKCGRLPALANRIANKAGETESLLDWHGTHGVFPRAEPKSITVCPGFICESASGRLVVRSQSVR